MIGVFDSGSGGLTVLQAIRAQAPQVDLLYLGDLANMPYGGRDAATLERLTFSMMRYLRAHGATTLVSACNSISASVIRPMFDLLGIRDASIIEMVGPALHAMAGHRYQRVVLWATPATVASELYQRAGQEFGLRMETLASHDLAALIENQTSEFLLRQEIARLAQATVVLQPDAIILGCTHYPLARVLIEEMLAQHGCRAHVFDPAPAVALEAVTRHGVRGEGRCEILISKEASVFRGRVEQLGIASAASIRVENW